MKIDIKSIFVITALSLLTITAFADSTVVGRYQCQRTDASGTTTNYPLTITKNSAGAYIFEWDSNGYPVLNGAGIAHPARNDLLAISFFDPKDQNNIGIELFQIKPDGSLQSNWAVQSSNQVGSEACTKSK